MKRRRLIFVLVLFVVILLSIFVAYPLVRDMFTPPITGLPATSAGNSLQARFTQTAQAKLSVRNASATPQTAP